MKEKFVRVESQKIRYLEAGDSKKVVVLVHGLGASAERWSHIIHELSKKYRVIAPDLPGFGYSDKPLLDYTPHFFAKSLFKLLESIGNDKAIMIGSSLGGQVVAEYAIRYHKKVEKIVLVSPAGVMKQTTPPIEDYVTAALYPNQGNVRNAFQMMSGVDKKVSPHIIENFIERMSLPNAKMSFMSTFLELKNSSPITDRLGKISIPSLVIWGKNDPVIPIKYADDFVNSIKNCQYIVMPNCGHTPYVEAPARFTKIVLNFLNESRIQFWLMKKFVRRY